LGSGYEKPKSKEIKMIPKHTAIIMDGNGRWAEQKECQEFSVIKMELAAVKKIVEEANKHKIEYFTLFTFSVENWDRPSDEVDTLMKLLVQTLKDEFEDIFNNNIKLNAIGDLNSLPEKVKTELNSIIENTKKNTGMTLTLALSYGGKQEIFKAVKEISEKVKNDIISLDNFDDSVINDHLYTRNLPDVDLLIRTSGEQRISNFLLWQIAYAELYFTDVYWPDFSEQDFTKAIVEYQNRERRFGKTSKQL
jgi:undecaprenyl diphosphate synthase